MLGTGTSNDPYIPENWAEFCQAVDTVGAYVSLPTNTTYDFNELYPAGFTGTIWIRCRRLNGNGSAVKNAVTRPESPLFLAKWDDSVSEIHDFDFINFEHNSTDGFINSKNNLSFFNCDFSGIIANGNMIIPRYSSIPNFTANADGGCSFNLKFVGNGGFISGVYQSNFNCCNIAIDGSLITSNTAQFHGEFKLTKSYLRGKWSPFHDLTVNAANSVLDIEMAEGKSITGTFTTTIINCDKAHNISGGIQVPEAHMRDAAYLRAAGFDI